MREAVACGSVLPRGEGDDSVEKGGGGIDNAMYTEDLGNLSDVGRNLQGEDRECGEGLMNAITEDWTITQDWTSLVKTTNKTPAEQLRKSPRKKSAEQNEGSLVAMGTSPKRKTPPGMG